MFLHLLRIAGWIVVSGIVLVAVMWLIGEIGDDRIRARDRAKR